MNHLLPAFRPRAAGYLLTGAAAALVAWSVLGLGAAAPAARAQQPGGELDAIKKRGKLIAGVKYDVPLFGLVNPISKRIDGFDVDLARALAKELLGSPDKIELIETVSANRVPFLQEDKVDVVISTMTINPERRQQIELSDVYYLAGQTLLVKTGSPIKGIDDLAGKTVTTVQGSTSEKNIAQKAPGAKFLLLKAYSECFNALQNGQADAMTTDDAILLGYKSRAPGKVNLVGGKFTSEPYGVGIKKGRTELLAFVNRTLEAMKKDGRWKAIYDKNIKPVSGQSEEPPAADAGLTAGAK